MRIGRKTDKFINLFEQHSLDEEMKTGQIEAEQTETDDTPMVDDLLAPYEKQLLDGIVNKRKDE